MMTTYIGKSKCEKRKKGHVYGGCAANFLNRESRSVLKKKHAWCKNLCGLDSCRNFFIDVIF